MAPWPNRLEDGQWQFDGKRFSASVNDLNGNNANHGLAFDKLFEIKSDGSANVTFATSLRKEVSYPFEVQVELSYHITDNGLSVELSVINHENFAVPFAAGLHPYFVCDDDSLLELHARKFVQKNSRGLPIAEIEIDASGTVRFGQNRIQDLQIDDCVFDFETNAGSEICTELIHESRKLRVKLCQSQNLNHLMIFKYQDKLNRTLLALEPQSAKANALRSEPGNHLLSGGECKRHQISITAEELA